MNFTSLTHSFFALEEELNLFEKKIDEVYFWELIRFGLHRQILQQKGLFGIMKVKQKENSIFSRYNVFNSFKNIFYKNPFVSPECDILFMGTPRRKKMIDGLWWDIYCDPVIEYLKHDFRCWLLENPCQNTHKIPPKTKNIAYTDIISFLSLLTSKSRLQPFSLTSAEQNLVEEIQCKIFDQFNVHIDLKKRVSGTLQYRKAVLLYYTLILKKLKPKLAIVICSYEGLKEVFIEACKLQAIPVVEFQHGTSPGRFHLGYSFHDGKYTKKLFPDYFFTFGDFWVKRIAHQIDPQKVISVGYPFFESEASKYRHLKSRKQIVFISQWQMGEAMSRFAALLDAREDFPLKIVYKLHPAEYVLWKNKYPWLVNSGVEVIDDDSIPLYKLLCESTAMIGVNSSVIYEGIGIGLHAFLLDLPGIEYMEELINSSLVTLTPTVDDLINNIKKLDAFKTQAPFFFKENSLENIKQSLIHILQNEKIK